MNANELIAHTAVGADIPKSTAAKVIDAYLSGITKSLKEGKDVTLSTIGKLSVKETSERAGRNPATGESITIPAGRKVKFTPAKVLKEAL
ncbi:HU family DNA-binding protein [Acetobacter persici]|uniref:Integration host factor n=1 Tax=Acetobacter persici TaxID=1076596 RepID=A0A1U9LIN4_9PROT|nr:HU family DNA-binding protein [Acetobacter persici]AQT06324.1 hypothetical protein A0U91_14970 [Acetobacter persici]